MRVMSLVVLTAALMGCDYGLTVVDAQRPPAAVRSVDIEDPRDGESLRIRWRPPTGATVRVLRTVGSDPTSSTDALAVAVYEGRDTEVVDTLTDVAVGTSVHYGVFVVDGEAASAGVFAAEVLSAFLPPDNAQAVANTDGSVQVSWSAPAVVGDVVGYRVRRDDVELTTTLTLDTTLLDASAPLDVLSTYAVVGVDDDGNETTAATVAITAISPEASVTGTVVVPSLLPTAQASDGSTLWIGGFLDGASISDDDDVYAPAGGHGAVLARATGAAGIIATLDVNGEQFAAVEAMTVAHNGDVVVAFSSSGLGEHRLNVGEVTTSLPSLGNDEQRLLLVRFAADATVLWQHDVAVGALSQEETFLAIDDDDSVWCGTTVYDNGEGAAVRLPAEVTGRSTLSGTDGPDAFVMHVDAAGVIDRADLRTDARLLGLIVDRGAGDVLVATVSSDFQLERFAFGGDGRLVSEVTHTFESAFDVTQLSERDGRVLAAVEGPAPLLVDGVSYNDVVGSGVIEFNADDDNVRISTPTVLVNGEPGEVDLDLAVLGDGTLAALVEVYKPGSVGAAGNVPLTITTTWGPVTVESTVTADSFGGGGISLFALLPDLAPTSTYGLAAGLEFLVPAGDAVWVGGAARSGAVRVLDVDVPHDTAAFSAVFALVHP